MKKKRIETRVGYVHKEWKLKRHKLCIYHSMIWAKKGPGKGPYEKTIKVKITIEEV